MFDSSRIYTKLKKDVDRYDQSSQSPVNSRYLEQNTPGSTLISMTLMVAVIGNAEPDATRDNVAEQVGATIAKGGWGLVCGGLAAYEIVAVGGHSGTLSEIAHAWQAGKPVCAFTGTPGWGSRLAGEALDEKRADQISEIRTIRELENWLKRTLAK